jgi:MOSC domain-containing protein
MLGRVIGVRWHPVKSMQGEDLTGSLFTERGIPGDRHWGIADSATGVVLSAKREPRLLDASVKVADAEVVITLPEGSLTGSADPNVDAVLSEWLGFGARLVTAEPDERATYEIGGNFEDDSHPLVHQWQGPAGTFHDSRPVHMLSTATLAAIAAHHPGGQFDIHRFRPNVVIDAEGEGFVEERWIGATLSVGSARFEVVKPTSRCVMTTRPQVGLPRDLEILRTINRVNDGNLGVQVHVVGEGVVSVGDAIELA